MFLRRIFTQIILLLAMVLLISELDAQVRVNTDINLERPICVGGKFEFDASESEGDPLDAFINYGDGTKDTLLGVEAQDLQELRHTYTTPGVYNLKFKLESGGDKDSVEYVITIYDRPVADFTVDVDTVCQGQSIDITNLTTSINAPITYIWRYGTSQNTEEEPDIQFLESGLHEISLTAYSDTNICSSIKRKDVFIKEDTALANFTFVEGCPCNEFSFNNTTSNKANIASWNWNFENGNSSLDEVPSDQTYLDPGKYYVSLTGTDNDGCIYTRRKLLSVCPDAMDSIPLSKSNNRWYFGNEAGIDFNAGAPVALLDAAATTPTNEGRATVSDHLTGDLLFWIGDTEVYNKNQVAMPNGSGLINGFSSSQGQLIVPHPGNVDQYYIFRTFGATSGQLGLYFCLVDMSLDGGNGDLLIKDSMLIAPREFGAGNYRSEHLSGVQRTYEKCDEKASYWVVSSYIKDYANIVHYYLVDESGMRLDHTQNLSHTHAGGNGGGTACFSSDGTKYALTNTYWGTEGRIFLYDFDKRNGLMYPGPKIKYTITGSVYGICFSPDNSKLYVSANGGGYIYQYDLDEPDVFASEVVVNMGGSNKYTMYRGPDNKIYVAQFHYEYVGVINEPNLKGTACNFVEDGVYLGGSGRESSHGLQNLLPRYPSISEDNFSVSADFSAETTNCNEIIFANNSDNNIIPNPDSCAYPKYYSYLWDFGDGHNDTVMLSVDESINWEEMTYQYQDSGNYTIQLIVSSSFSCSKDTFDQVVSVKNLNSKGIHIDTTNCKGQNMRLSASVGVNYQWLPEDGLSCTDCQTPETLITNDSKYSVLITDEEGCKQTDSFNIKGMECGVYIPNAFSPNGDNDNSLFYMVSQGISDYQLQVFDRKGKLIFEDINMHLKWDGTYKGESLPEGVYTFYTEGILDSGESFRHSGNITLLR